MGNWENTFDKIFLGFLSWNLCSSWMWRCVICQKKGSLKSHEDGGNLDGLYLLVLLMVMKESALNSHVFW